MLPDHPGRKVYRAQQELPVLKAFLEWLEILAPLVLKVYKELLVLMDLPDLLVQQVLQELAEELLDLRALKEYKVTPEQMVQPEPPVPRGYKD